MKKISHLPLIGILSLLFALLGEAVIHDSTQAGNLRTEQTGEIHSLMDISTVSTADYEDFYYSQPKAFRTQSVPGGLLCLDFSAKQIGSVRLIFDAPLEEDTLIVLNWNHKPIAEYGEKASSLSSLKNEDENTDEIPVSYAAYKTSRMWADAGADSFLFSLPEEDYTHLDFYVGQKERYITDVLYSTEPLQVTSGAWKWTNVLLLYAIAVAVLLMMKRFSPCLIDSASSFLRQIIQKIAGYRKRIFKGVLILAGCLALTAAYEFGDYAVNEYLCIQKGVFCLGLLLTTAILWFGRKDFTEHLDKYLFLLILTVGFVVAGANFYSNTCFDSDVHYRRALKSSYFFSDTAIITQADAYYTDCGEVFLGDRNSEELFRYRTSGSPESLATTRKALNQAYTSGNYYLAESLHGYQALSYLPFGIQLFLGRTLHMPFTMLYLFGKMGVLLVYAVCMSVSCKRLKSRRLLFAVLSLLPMHLFMAGNYSYDAFLTGFFTLGIVYLMEELREPEIPISRKSAFIILFSLLAGLAPKPVYFPVFLLIFFLPREKFSTPRRHAAFKWGAVLILLFIVGYLVINMGAPMEGGSGTKGGDIHDYDDMGIFPSQQVKYVLTHPFVYLGVLFRHLIQFFSPKNFDEIFGDWKTLGTLPEMYCHVSFGLIFMTMMIDCNDREQFRIPERKQLALRAGLAVLSVMTVVIICTSLYCGNTRVGAETIEGVQPRYYIPLLFPLSFLIVSTGITRNKDARYFDIVLPGAAALTTLLAVNEMVIGHIVTVR